MNDIGALPITDQVVTARTVQEVHDCLVPLVSAVAASPIEVGSGDHRVLAFTGNAGVFLHYTLDAVDRGTRVSARRRGVIGDNYRKSLGCFPPR